MLQRFREWLGSYSITAKSLVCAWLALAVLYVENPAFHNYVFALFSRFPHFLQEFVVGFVVPVTTVAIGHARKERKP
jgi:hypothetical protein